MQKVDQRKTNIPSAQAKKDSVNFSKTGNFLANLSFTIWEIPYWASQSLNLSAFVTTIAKIFFRASIWLSVLVMDANTPTSFSWSKFSAEKVKIIASASLMLARMDFAESFIQKNVSFYSNSNEFNLFDDTQNSEMSLINIFNSYFYYFRLSIFLF